jgi:hypothetical protein
MMSFFSSFFSPPEVIYLNFLKNSFHNDSCCFKTGICKGSDNQYVLDGEGNRSAFRGRTAEPPQLRFRGLGTPVFPQESTQFPSPFKQAQHTPRGKRAPGAEINQHLPFKSNKVYENILRK